MKLKLTRDLESQICEKNDKTKQMRNGNSKKNFWFLFPMFLEKEKMTGTKKTKTHNSHGSGPKKKQIFCWPKS